MQHLRTALGRGCRSTVRSQRHVGVRKRMLGNVSTQPAPERERIKRDAKKCRLRVLIAGASRRESWARVFKGVADEPPSTSMKLKPGPNRYGREALRREPQGTSAFERRIQTCDRRLGVDTSRSQPAVRPKLTRPREADGPLALASSRRAQSVDQPIGSQQQRPGDRQTVAEPFSC